MEKKIKISAKFDMQEFDRQVRSIKDKVADMYKPSDFQRARMENARKMEQQGIAPGGFSAQAEQNYRKAVKQDTRELENFIRTQTVNQGKLDKAIENRTKKLKDLKSEYQEIVKLGKEDLKMKEEISKFEASRSRLLSTRAAREQAIGNALEVRNSMQQSLRPQGMDRLINAYSHGGMGGMGRAGVRMLRQNPGMAMAGLGNVLGGIGTATQMAVPVLRQEDTADRRMLSAQGQTVQGAGYLARNVMNGRAEENFLYSQEQNRAMQNALEEMRRQRRTDLVKGIGSGMGIVGGGLSVAGGLASTGVGALPAIGVGLASAGYGAYNFIADEQLRNKTLGGMGFDSYQQRYESGLTQQMMSNFKQNLESEKQLNPFKRMGQQYYEQRGQGNLSMQRQLGLNDNDFYGNMGYLSDTFTSGFDQQQGMRTSQQIIASGGSTRMARNPEDALALNRDLNLTNAGQVMGRLSGTMGGRAESRNATIKVLAEAFNQGLDSSQFAEEQRKFTGAVSEMVYRSGTTDAGGAGAIANNFASFLTGRTGRAIQGAQGAYQAMQGITGEAGGIRGAIQAANIMNDESLGKMSFDQRMAFMNLSEEQINAGGAMVEEMARSAGLSVEEFKKKAVDVKRKGVGLRNSTDKLAETYRKQVGQGDNGGAKRTLGQLEAALMSEDQSIFKGMGVAERESFTKAFATGQQDAGPTGDVEAKIGRDTGRIGDVTQKARARADDIALEQFNRVKDDLRQAAQDASNMNSATMEALMGLANAIKNEGEESVKEFAESLKTLSEEMRNMNRGSGDIGAPFMFQPTGGSNDGQ